MEEDEMFQTFVVVAIITMCMFCFCVCSMCCCFFICFRKRQRQQAMFSTPVVITSQNYEARAGDGPYQVPVMTSRANTNPHTGVQQPTQQQHFPVPPSQQDSFQVPYPPLPFSNEQEQTPPNTTATPAVPHIESIAYMKNPPTYNQAIGNEALPEEFTFRPAYKS